MWFSKYLYQVLGIIIIIIIINKCIKLTKKNLNLCKNVLLPSALYLKWLASSNSPSPIIGLYIYIYIIQSLVKIKLKSKLNFNWSSIWSHVSYLIFNFCTKWIIEYENKKFQIQLDSKLVVNWSPILCHMFIYLFFLFIFLWQVNYLLQKSKNLDPTLFLRSLCIR